VPRFSFLGFLRAFITGSLPTGFFDAVLAFLMLFCEASFFTTDWPPVLLRAVCCK